MNNSLRKIQQAINKYCILPFFIKKRRNLFSFPITIISSDCSGGVLLHDYGLPWDTPTVNLVIRGSSFARFCSNLDYYLGLELREVSTNKNSKIPYATCGDILIEGTHYRSFQDLRDAWNRRKARIHKDRLVYLMTERQLESNEDFQAYASLLGNKIFLSSETFASCHPGAIGVKHFEKMFLFKGFSGRRYIDFDFHFGKYLQDNF